MDIEVTHLTAEQALLLVGVAEQARSAWRRPSITRIAARHLDESRSALQSATR